MRWASNPAIITSATETTLDRNKKKNSGFQRFGSGLTRMTVGGQNRKGASSPIRTKKPRDLRPIICPRNTAVDSRNFDYSKQRLILGTWDERSLVTDSSKHYQLYKAFSQYNIDILSVTETHTPGIAVEDLKREYKFMNSGRAL